MEKFKDHPYTLVIYDRLALSGDTAHYKYRYGLTPFDQFLKTARDMGRSKAKWVRLWLSESKSIHDFGQPTTGMFNSGEQRFMFGDLNLKNDFLIFEYWEMGTILYIYFFPKFYPKNPRKFAKDFALIRYKEEGAK